MQESKRYIIIGGGISGLATAKFIRKAEPDAKICLYESSNRLGGRCGSYYDKQLNCKLDYATHAVLKANKNAVQMWGIEKFFPACAFYHLDCKRLSTSPFSHLNEIALALFNLPLKQTAPKLIRKTLTLLFPFLSARKVHFSGNNTQETFISPQVQYFNEIHYNHTLREIEATNGEVKKLVFQNSALKISAQDRIILAVSPSSACRLLGLENFEFNPIINLHYRTSVPLTLPKERPFLSVCGGIVQWVSVKENVLSVTISNAAALLKEKELPRLVWKEICVLRGVKAAFVPPCRVVKYPRATLLHSAENDNRRPSSCQTQYSNLFLAGDWTMKHLPCSIETAILSAKRAARAARKYKKR